MGKYTYTDDEYDRNKVLKYNQNLSAQLSHEVQSTRSMLDHDIADAEALLRSLGKPLPKKEMHKTATAADAARRKTLLEETSLPAWKDLVAEANHAIPEKVELEDVLTAQEFQSAYQHLDEIETAFDKETSLNPTDRKLLAVATGLLTIKALITPVVLNKLGYGSSFDPSKRMKHNDPSIQQAHRNANDAFKNSASPYHENGYWMNLLYQTVPFDTTVGSPAIGYNMEGGYHRLHTLGHDPLLGWVFGTANILTDTVTFDTLATYRVARKPKLMITPQAVTLPELFLESFDVIRADSLNLPAALFAEAQHLKSDEYTKAGLPIPVLSTFSPELAGKLYKSRYDQLCLMRDIKLVGMSAAISLFFNMVFAFVHGLFYTGTKANRNLHEVKTRKILLIANAIAGGSSVLHARLLKNPKKLDLGQLLVTASRLFSDLRFIAKIKEEYIAKEQDQALLQSLNDLNRLASELGGDA